jgi:hypothetical protein
MLEADGSRLEKGEALLELVSPEGPVTFRQDGVTATVRKPGLYGFDQKHGVMTVYSGEAQFSRDGRETLAGAGFSVGVRHLLQRPLVLTAGDPLFSWSWLRSEQLSGGIGPMVAPPPIPMTAAPAPQLPAPETPGPGSAPPTVPLTLPGVPQFPR